MSRWSKCRANGNNKYDALGELGIKSCLLRLSWNSFRNGPLDLRGVVDVSFCCNVGVIGGNPAQGQLPEGVPVMIDSPSQCAANATSRALPLFALVCERSVYLKIDVTSMLI